MPRLFHAAPESHHDSVVRPQAHPPTDHPAHLSPRSPPARRRPGPPRQRRRRHPPLSAGPATPLTSWMGEASLPSSTVARRQGVAPKVGHLACRTRADQEPDRSICTQRWATDGRRVRRSVRGGGARDDDVLARRSVLIVVAGIGSYGASALGRGRRTSQMERARRITIAINTSHRLVATAITAITTAAARPPSAPSAELSALVTAARRPRE